MGRCKHAWFLSLEGQQRTHWHTLFMICVNYVVGCLRLSFCFFHRPRRTLLQTWIRRMHAKLKINATSSSPLQQCVNHDTLQSFFSVPFLVKSHLLLSSFAFSNTVVSFSQFDLCDIYLRNAQDPCCFLLLGLEDTCFGNAASANHRSC